MELDTKNATSSEDGGVGCLCPFAKTRRFGGITNPLENWGVWRCYKVCNFGFWEWREGRRD